MVVYLSFVMLFAPVLVPKFPFISKLYVVGIVFVFYVLIPFNISVLLKYFCSVKNFHFEEKKENFIQYFLVIISFIAGLRILVAVNTPATFVFIMRGVVLTMLLYSIVSVFTKVCGYAVSIGGAFNINYLLCIMYGIDLSNSAIIIALLIGIVGWSCLYFKRHTMDQIIYGLILGYLSMKLSLYLYAFL